MACGGCGNRNNEVAIPQRIPNVKEPTGETTQCQCQFPDGQDTIFCERHQCTKTRPLHHLCKHREDYFHLWEDGHGPMQDMQDTRSTLSQPPQPARLPQPSPKQTTGFFKEENTEDAGSSGPQGLGDTVAKITEATGIKAVVDAVGEATGRDCGCQERQNKLNEMFPYKQKKTKGFFQ
jgi:hypothetical protein